jgi:HEAT repeat protein
MRLKYVIFSALLGLFLTAAASNASQDTELKRKIDSLFVIASSGELKYRDMTEPAMDSIAAFGAEAVPILIDKFTTKSARERWTVIWILQRIGSPAVPYLVNALKRPDGLVVQRVCWALGDIGDTAAVEPLIGVTTHSRWQVREQAVGALGKIGDRRGQQAVMSALNDPIGQVRKAAAVSCGKLQVEQSIEQLVHMLGDDFYGARLAAVEALLKLDTDKVVTTLADSLNSANELVGDLGCYLLGQFGTDAALDLLMSQTGSADPDRRAHAAIALIKADPDDNCGYHQLLLERETDRLNRLKIKSALSTERHVR